MRVRVEGNGWNDGRLPGDIRIFCRREQRADGVAYLLTPGLSRHLHGHVREDCQGRGVDKEAAEARLRGKHSNEEGGEGKGKTLQHNG